MHNATIHYLKNKNISIYLNRLLEERFIYLYGNLYLLKDKTKNKSSYRSLPLLPIIADVLKKYKKKKLFLCLTYDNVLIVIF